MILLPTKLFALKGSENMHLYRFALPVAFVALLASIFSWNVFEVSVGYLMLVVGWLLFGAYWKSASRNWWITVASVILLALPPVVGVDRHLVAVLDGWLLTVIRLLGVIVIFAGLAGVLIETFAKEEETRRIGKWIAIWFSLIVPFVTYGSMAMGLIGAGVAVLVFLVVGVLVRPKPQESTKEVQPV